MQAMKFGHRPSHFQPAMDTSWLLGEHHGVVPIQLTLKEIECGSRRGFHDRGSCCEAKVQDVQGTGVENTSDSESSRQKSLEKSCVSFTAWSLILSFVKAVAARQLLHHVAQGQGLLASVVDGSWTST